MKPLISLQLWSVQDACQENFEEVLTKVKEYGYDGVEFAGYYGCSAEEIKKTLAELSLKVSGAHISFEALRDDFEKTINFEKEIGNQAVIVPYMGADSLEEWTEKILALKEIAKKVNSEGLVLGYHNHAHEIMDIPDVNILEKMVEMIPDIQLEVDTYWLSYAGVDVLAWLKKYQKNIKWLHLKDMLVTGEEKESTEIGQGILPIESYLNWAKNANLEWVVIEQEAFQKLTPMESAAVNVKTLKELR
ncbi:sugar phosphate isomerase/epimerase [Vagococcus fluvialis]|uniref:sugar phosphate isomerase/epimerase family protein n=1 Tax=Vagococcus fluvialis TaxID=2738 RepID=UPI001432F2A1|nr:sugar phosphate isomerase/epimerase [Vagococcus fluvialis]NKC59437.1 sugar phosphate isomerase/epimerase [Vagococcus fluvialis]NKD50479.1 sugar phosphate isomerase/epimerase [Vagococcus fluvialis]